MPRHRLVAALALTLLALGPSVSGQETATERPSITGAVLVVCQEANLLQAIDLATGVVSWEVEVAEGPSEVAVSPDGLTAVVTQFGTGGVYGTKVQFIDLATREITRTIDLAEHRGLVGIQFLADGRLAVASRYRRSVVILDLETGQQIQIPLEQNYTERLVLSSSGDRLYAVNLGGRTVSSIDPSQDSVVGLVDVGAGPTGAALTPRADELWVTNQASSDISIVDPETMTVVVTIPCANFPRGIAISPDGQHAVATGGRSSDAIVFSVDAREEIARIGFEYPAAEREANRTLLMFYGDTTFPNTVAFTPDGKFVLVSNEIPDRIAIIDAATWELVGDVSTAAAPVHFTIVPELPSAP